MNELPKLGQLVPVGENRRDAVHIAIAPVTADQDLIVGSHVGLKPGTTDLVGYFPSTAVGIVDPFLTERVVKKGQRFWLFLYPGTVTSLRHVWTHPAFTAAYHQKQKESGQ